MISFDINFYIPFHPLKHQDGFPVGPFAPNMLQFWPMVFVLIAVTIFENTIRFQGIVWLVYYGLLAGFDQKKPGTSFCIGHLFWLTWLCFAHVDFSGRKFRFLFWTGMCNQWTCIITYNVGSWFVCAPPLPSPNKCSTLFRVWCQKTPSQKKENDPALN